MGVMRFLVHPDGLLNEWPEAYRAYVSGPDGRVFPTRVEIDGHVLTCRRQNSDSGRLHVAWPVPGFGRPIIATASLREQELPYVLAVELTRGKICQVRNQLAVWEGLGVCPPDEFRHDYREAHRLFGKAVAVQDAPDRASALANQAIQHACLAAESLADAYIRERLEVRRRRMQHPPALFGCNLGGVVPAPSWERAFCDAFNAASVPIDWQSIEPNEGQYAWELSDQQVDWCHQHKLLIRGGPLIDLAPDGLPQWLWQWEHDFPNLLSFVCDFVETAITRYVGRIRHWEVSAHGNSGGALAMNEEQRLTLVARTLEVARQVDPETQFLIRVDQPWGGYQARGQHRLSPIQFVDALLRCGLGLDAVNLEIGIGYRPRGSASRDLLEFSRLIDQWSSLGIPLHITLAVPSSGTVDPASNPDLEVDLPSWKSGWSETLQAEWIDHYLPMLVAKQSVVGVYWPHFSDLTPHRFPHAGLLRPDGTPKLALEHIARHRRTL